MIIQIVGTNAAGKTTAMRKILAMGQDLTERLNEKGKVVAHDLTLAGRAARILGPYTESGPASKGMDYLGGTAEWQYEYVKENYGEVEVLLYEGMRMHNGKRTADLIKAGWPVHLILLTTPIEDVLAGLTERRAARGQEPLADTTHILLNDKRAKSFVNNMLFLGASVHRVPRNAVPEKVLEILTNPTLLV